MPKCFFSLLPARCFFYDTFTKLSRHLLPITAIERQFVGNLLIRQIQSHEIEAQDPHLQGLMMAGKDGVGEIIVVCRITFRFSDRYIFYLLAGGQSFQRVRTMWLLWSCHITFRCSIMAVVVSSGFPEKGHIVSVSV